MLAAISFISAEIVYRMSLSISLPLGPPLRVEKALSAILKLASIVPAAYGIVSLIVTLIKGKLFNKVNNLQEIESLNWKEFEFLIGEYYRRKGYSVTQLGGDLPDGGIDLTAKKDGRELVIQCKHWKAYKVDVKIVREVYGVMVDAAASGAVIITSGSFTQPSIDFAQDKPVELIDGPKLVKLISEVKAVAVPQKPIIPLKSRATLVPTEPPPLSKEEQDRKFMPPAMRAELAARDKSQTFADVHPICPICKTRMVLRTTHHNATSASKFWGCPNYPKCHHTRSLATN